MELSTPNIKKFLMFQEMELFKKTSCISGGNFPSSKNEKKETTLKKFGIFQEMEPSNPKLKQLLYFF